MTQNPMCPSSAATQLTVSKVLAYVELVYNTRQKRLAGEAQRQALLEKGQELHELTALEKVCKCRAFLMVVIST